MNLPLFHDPLQGTVIGDAQPVRDPRVHRPVRTSSTPARHEGRRSKPSRSRQREVAGVAEDLQALMARTMPR
ncbi:hypothetical protein [Paenarthrobacter histidinolovorans]|uniref:hypothetical protein n=1 Tax=Paenarthrobacter histidinolovorans TaxID=43664 RepID=UPI001662FB8F|nr:hypothetical protein [Paenarthrobacter histidinolovorans]GGJ41058.1 hypothetical protein GCM10010052_42710 [Paenarthrobacter histidinolovorans]